MNFFNHFRAGLGAHSDLILVLVVVSILMILFTPIPPGLLDLLIISNLAFGMLVLLLTFYVDRPVDFSTFPSLLLIATLFRLALNIAATRLILSEGDAGEVIGAIGTYVVSGNYVIGMIVFLVLIVVQYVVVTNGAQRVAEVAARFTLDSMPGKQMSIDADMNIGVIDEKEAQRRRKEIEKEGNFYGAMDGASKFVKGDAIAGIVIILIDIIGGLTIGLAQLGMDWGEALETYTLLTIGDGIVTQIPALIISTGTGIIVTRAVSSRTLSQDVTDQVTSHPKTLLLIAAGLGLMLLLPGIPAFPVFVVMLLVSALFWVSYRKSKQPAVEGDDAESEEDVSIYDEIRVPPIAIQLSAALAGDLREEIMNRVAAFRKEHALNTGLVVPAIKIMEERSLEDGAYKILIQGVESGSYQLRLDHVLALDAGAVKEVMSGDATEDPSFHLPGVWVGLSQRNQAALAGYTVVEPVNVLMTHLTEIIKKSSEDILTRSEVDNLLNSVRKYNPGLVDELVPGIVSVGLIRKVLAGLLSESVPIRNLEKILEVLSEEGRGVQSPELLVELTRRGLKATIFESLADSSNVLKVLILDPAIESTMKNGLKDDRLVLEPRFSEQVMIRVAAQVEKMVRSGVTPAMVCAPELRPHISKIFQKILPTLRVISMSEVPTYGTVKSYAVVTV